ncbi:hypothetical protein [Bradyrhizobium sp.]|uniref:hypothetical protein n=1 Tax=Bradyrhizobium sp. TaxID=376 RepID=UPI0025C2F9AA|nr:hypothetical protein [Bradyrhizobium sp.]
MAHQRDESSNGDTEPKIIRLLANDIAWREPWPSENEFFKMRPEVAGLAAEDDCVVLNPYSNLSANEKEAVLLNESARVFMRRSGFCPVFTLTAEQASFFANYGPVEAVRATVAARIFSGDPSALEATDEQFAFVQELRKRMGS